MPDAARTTFAEALPFETFRELHATLAHESNEPFREAIEQIAKPALRAMIQDRLEAGLLRDVPDATGHEFWFMSAWNDLVAGRKPSWNPGKPMDDVVDYLVHATVGRACIRGGLDGKGEESALRTYHDMLCRAMDAGTITHYDLDSQTCGVTGEIYRVAFDGWNPRFLQRGKDGNLAWMEPGEVAAVIELEVEFETGELLVADWFRIEAFTDAVRDKAGSVGSVAGRERTATRYAELGFVSIHVDNTSPDIFARDGVLVFGDGEEDAVGSVCTDYWGVTVIDRARLVGIVAEALGAEAAERTVADYLAEHDVQRLSVDPGRHWVYMSGDSDGFAGLFSPDGLDLDGLEPKFVLSDRRLSLEYNAAPPSP